MNKHLLAGLLLGCMCASAGALDLVRNGKPEVSVMVGENPSQTELFAASELREYLRKITGAKVKQGALPGMLPVRIGLVSAGHIAMTPALKKASDQIRGNGFVIEAGAAGIQIAAKTERGLLHGVYHLLKKYGGVRWFHPDEDEFVPQKRDFSVPDQLTVKNAAFSEPEFPGSAFNPPHRILWRVRNGLLARHGRIGDPNIPPIMEMQRKVGPVYTFGGHVMTNLLVGYYHKEGIQAARAKLFAEHPEYFGLKNGKRVLSGDDIYLAKQPVSQPCTSNPEVLKRMARHIQEVIDREFKGEDLVWRFLNDDHMNWCECAECVKLDAPGAAPNGRRSDRWWTFINHMAKELLPKNPKLRFKVLAYQDFRLPPLHVKPDPRVIVQICPHGSCYAHALNDPACPVNASYRKMFEMWRDAGASITSYEYHTQSPGKVSYIPYERAWVNDLKYYHSFGAAGFSLHLNDGAQNFHKQPYYETYRYRNMWLANWQLAWLTGHFAWNIDDDFDTVWEDVNSKYYGPAWKYMKEYWCLLEKTFADSGVHTGYGLASAAQSLGKCYEAPGLAKKAKELLDLAEKAAGDNPVYLRRVARDREYFRKDWEEAGFSAFRGAERTIQVRCAENPIVLDGVFSEKDWIKAEWCGELFKILNGGGKKEKAVPGTRFKMLYDKENLYFALEAEKIAGKVNDCAVEDGFGAMKGSHLELFLVPPALEGKYWHIAFSRNGKKFSALTTDGKTRDLQKKVNFTCKIADAPDKWCAEVKVPLAALGGIRSGDCWKVNVGRSAVGAKGTMTNSSFSGGSFHALEYYPVVSFGTSGLLILNGDFEDVGPVPLPKTDRWGYRWEFLSENMPLKWHYLMANSGKGEVRSDTPASGKNYLRMDARRRTPILSQMLQSTDMGQKKFFVSMKLRGKGVVVPTLACKGKMYKGEEIVVNVPEWTLFSAALECPVSGAKEFRLLFYGKKASAGVVDIDDVKIVPVQDEVMPDVMKHH